MQSISITINDQKIKTTRGKTIYQVVQENKLDHIPTLCNDSRLEPYGSCFVCVVKVEGMQKLVPSCSTLVSEGMCITTNNLEIRDARKTALELLLSNHYADCVGVCSTTCPASVDIQGYISYINNGQIKEAISLIKEKNPLPLVCGRVCVHECEIACRRNLVDEAVAINPIKRYIADLDIENPWQPPVKRKTGIKIAVIGGGPSGLSCTYYLAINSMDVTIFDKMPHLGGMLRYGIPEYRLPKADLDKEISQIINLGVHVKTNTQIGKRISVSDLLHEGYSAAYIAIGAWKATSLRLENEETTSGVIKGIDFLRDVELKGIPQLKGHVIVVGGGNTAIDAARTALRCGAKRVTLVYRRSRKEMPAHHLEVEAALEEGVQIQFLTNPVQIISKNNILTGIVCIKMRLEKGQPGKRPRPLPIPGSESKLECDYLISAIGQAVEAHSFNEKDGCELQRWGTIKVDEQSMQTAKPGIFAGGDAVSGPLTAINAIAHGRKAAESIIAFLNGNKTENKNNNFISQKQELDEISGWEYEHMTRVKRQKTGALPVDQRINNFQEVDTGLAENRVGKETERCLQCGCSQYHECLLQRYATEYEVDIARVKGEVRKYKEDDSHPFIHLNPNKCINCGRCIRTCTEILDVAALGFVNRGYRAVVKPAMEKPLLQTNCISCGNCIDACPTGAITEKFARRIPGTIARENHLSLCYFCSLGCSLNYKVINQKLFHVANTTEDVKESYNRGYVCAKGRFGYHYFTDESRLLNPLKKGEDKLQKTDYEEAIEHTAGRIKEIIRRYGCESVAVFCAPTYSNEALYLLQKFARRELKTNNIASLSYLLYGRELYCLEESLGFTCSTVTLEQAEKADLLITVNMGIGAENMMIDLIRKRVQKAGGKSIVIESSALSLAGQADLRIDSKKGTNTVLFNGIIRSIMINKTDALSTIKKASIDNREKLAQMVSVYDEGTVLSITGLQREKYRSLLDLLSNPKANIVFIYNIDQSQDKSAHDIEVIVNFLLLTGRIKKQGNGILLMRDYLNSQGLLDMGVTPRYLPGYIKYGEQDEIQRISSRWESDLGSVFKQTDIVHNLNQGMIKAALIFGEDPLYRYENYKYFQDLEFLLVHDLFLTNTAKEADIVIPAATYLQETGTYTSCDGRVNQVPAIMDAQNEKTTLTIIQELICKFNPRQRFQTTEEVFNEIKEVNRFYKHITHGKSWIENLDKENYFKPDGRINFSLFDTKLEIFKAEKPSILFSDHYYRNIIESKLIL